MTEATPPNQLVESNPTVRAKISSLIGRIGTRGTTIDYDGDSLRGPDINTVLDSYERRTDLAPDSPEADRLVEAMRHCQPLEKPTFMSSRVFAHGPTVAIISASVAHPVSLPTRNFISAPAMIDWDHGRDTTTSRRKIRAYTRHSSQAPPIGMVAAYVQPDGRTLFSAIQDGAHRIAAAHLRGDPTILVGNSIAVYRTPQNILPVHIARGS